MTNTLLAEGTDDEEEIIRSVDNGLFVQTIGGGFGGSQFSLAVQEGYWIKDGKLDRQVKNIMLTGSGIDVIKRIDRVGKHLELESGAFCGAGSGLVPTTTPQPMCRISSMSIG
jgi:TldD protein